MHQLSIHTACQSIRRGHIVAYPTEAVYGLGCDPLNEDAVRRLMHIKQRPATHGFILIADDFAVLNSYCGTIPEHRQQLVMASWPGPHTWVYPKSKQCPDWLCGAFNSIAVRVSAHPVVRALCAACGQALVSSSANQHGKAALKTSKEVMDVFAGLIDGVVEGELGDQAKPTAIRDALSGETLRAG